MSLTHLLVPTVTQMLRHLAAWLEKAAAHEAASARSADALMSLRLAPDMYPLAAQVRFVCFLAQEPFYRLRSAPLTEGLTALRQEGWNAGEQPGTLKEAQARIAQALAFLDAQATDALDQTALQPVALDLPDGNVFDMTGEQYVRDWALPQFYFHVVTAYGILRHQGVALGKIDYVPHMLAYLRRG